MEALDREIAALEREIIALDADPPPIPVTVLPPVPGKDVPFSADYARRSGVEYNRNHDFLYAMVEQGGFIEIGEAADALFGEDNRRNRQRVRKTLIYMAKGKRLIKNLGYRRWEIRR